MTTPLHAGRSSTASTGSSSSDDQWLRDFREAKQSILTTTTAPGSTPSSPQRLTAELKLGVGQLQHEVKSIVDMLQLERAAAAAEGREAVDGPPKITDGKSGVLVKCVPAASPLSSSSPSSSSSSRASSPSSTSSSADDDSEESNSSSSSSSSSSSMRRTNSFPSHPYPSSSPPPPHVSPFDGTTVSNEPSSSAEHLQWPRQQHHQSWQQLQQRQQLILPLPMPSARAATTSAAAVHPTYLLAMVQEEKEQGQRQAARIQELELALLETQQECGVAIASARLESHELKCMLRRMASESTFADVFQVYEAHIARLEQEVHMLRERNVHLEERRQPQQLQQQQQQQRDLQGFRSSITFEGQGEEGREGHDGNNDDDEEDRDDSIHRHGNSSPTRRGPRPMSTTTADKARQSLTAGPDVYHHHGKSGGLASTPSSGIKSKSKRSNSGGMNHVPGQGEGTGSAAAAAATATAVALRGRIKDLQRQVGELKQETGELRRRERQFLVQKRMVETTWARAQKVQAMAKGLEGSLASCRLEGARAEARLEEAEEEIQALRQREAALVLDRDKVLLELDLVHRQLGGVNNGLRWR